MTDGGLPICEPFAVPDVYVTGMLDVDVLTPDTFRLTFTVNHRSTIDGSFERLVVARLVVCRSMLRCFLPKLSEAAQIPEAVPGGDEIEFYPPPTGRQH